MLHQQEAPFCMERTLSRYRIDVEARKVVLESVEGNDLE
jgi:hypothetical protein